jgi:glutathione S-transferase
MQLIGMLDSPYVRRVAVSLKLMGVPFEHQAVSVFRHFDRFRAINPAVKAPTLVCDDGTVLMDSTLILDHLESLVAADRRLMPAGGSERREALRIAGLALAACEKCVQVIYEKQQRPAEKRHAPWIERSTGQAEGALAQLERTAAGAAPWLQGERLGASDVVVACMWRFAQYYRDEVGIPESRYPRLAQHSRRAEALPEFASTPLD